MAVFGFQSGTSPLKPHSRTWSEAFATSPCLGGQTLLGLRLLLALIMLGHWIHEIVSGWDRGFFFIYLTHWSLTTELICIWLLVLATIVAMRDKPEQRPKMAVEDADEGSDIPLLCRVAIAVFSMELPMSIMVVILYWTLENPVWTLPPGYRTDYMNMYVHGFQCLGLLISFLVGRIPYRIANSGWFVLFVLTYIAFSLLHFLLHIGVAYGCSKYPRDECPIYDVFDWHMVAKSSTISCIVVFVVCPVLICLCWLMGRLRDNVDICLSGSTHASVFSSLELGVRDAKCHNEDSESSSFASE